MHDFAGEILKKGQPFQKQLAVDWFKQKYPRIKSNTVGMHVEGMSTNNVTQRKHHKHIRPGQGWDLFFKETSNRFRLWDSATDPAPLYGYDIENQAEEITSTETSVEEVDQFSAGDTEFALEADLRNYLSRNLGLIESGLTLYKDEDGSFDGVEFPVGSRRIDILAVGRDKALVVIELKVSRGYDRVIGQLLRYMAWVKANIAGENSVRGVIVASEVSEDLKLAASLVKDVQLFEYEIKFQLRTA